jgi:hypothetical protein
MRKVRRREQPLSFTMVEDRATMTRTGSMAEDQAPEGPRAWVVGAQLEGQNSGSRRARVQRQPGGKRESIRKLQLEGQTVARGQNTPERQLDRAGHSGA